MPTRISLRRVDSSTRKLMAVPGSLAELLENVTKKLKLPSGATSIRTEKGDEVEDDADVALLRDDEVVFVLCGEEEFPLPGAAAAEPGPSPTEPPSPATQPATPAKAPPEPPIPAAEPPPASAGLPAATKDNPFDIVSLDDETAEAAARAAEATPPAASAAPISEAATRDLVKANTDTAFSLMARSGGGGRVVPFCLKKMTESGKSANPGLYAFCQNADKYLQKREPASEGAAASSSDAPPLPPALLMGEWEKVPVPPEVIRKDRKATWLGGFKPKLSAMKAVYRSRKLRKGVTIFEYPQTAALMKQEVSWHDFKSVVSVAHHAFIEEEAKAKKAEAKAAKPSSGDRGGVVRLRAAFDDAEVQRKLSSKTKQEGWSAREADIGRRLEVANDALACALEPEREAAMLLVASIEEEQRNFNTVRSRERVELEQERLARKRKHDAEMAEQRAYNSGIKGEGRKKMKQAMGQATPMEEDPQAAPASASAATAHIGRAAAARVAMEVAATAAEAEAAEAETGVAEAAAGEQAATGTEGEEPAAEEQAGAAEAAAAAEEAAAEKAAAEEPAAEEQTGEAEAEAAAKAAAAAEAEAAAAAEAAAEEATATAGEAAAEEPAEEEPAAEEPAA